MKTIVNCKTWRAGGSPFGNSTNTCGYGSTYLLNNLGQSCCLGFAELQNGRSVNEIVDICTPASLNYQERDYLQIITNSLCNSKLAVKAVDVNDDSETSILQKINLLTNIFKDFGHEIEFDNIEVFLK